MTEDEKILLEKVQSKNDKMALGKLIKLNEGLIWSVVKKFLGKGYEKEDLYQIGCIGFIKSIKRFDLKLDYKLSTYAVPYITGEIKKFFRDDGIVKISRSLKELGIKVNSVELNDEGGDKVDEQSNIIDRLTVNGIVESLEVREKTIIKLRYFKEETQVQVAKTLGISQVQVSRIEKKVLKHMREQMVS